MGCAGGGGGGGGGAKARARVRGLTHAWVTTVAICKICETLACMEQYITHKHNRTSSNEYPTSSVTVLLCMYM